jgi:hypothetical protein
VLKTRIALLSGLVVFAVVIEAGDSQPRPISRGLTGLRVETSGKREVTGKYRTVALQIVSADATILHPEVQALVANELSHAYRLIDGGVLCLIAMQFVFVDQQGACPFPCSLLS